MATISSTHSSPRAHYSPPSSAYEQINPIVHDMWERLRLAGDQSGPHAVSAFLVGSNAASVACPLRTVVSVKSNADEVFIHANRIDFLNGVSPRPRRCPTTGKRAVAVAGQSPQNSALCERFLMQGLHSEAGLFQFVSRRAHSFSEGTTVSASKENPVIDQLRKEWAARGEVPGSLHIGGRYAVMKFEKFSADAMHCTYLLTVHDLQDDNLKKTIPLTQVAPKFSSHVLGVQQIEQANTLINAHNTLLETLSTTSFAASVSQHRDPMIISYAGIGRNATLIAYREALSRMDQGLDAQGLDAALEDIVQQGRRDRGPGFIHSEAQLAALREALMAELSRRRANTEIRVSTRSHSPDAAASQTAFRLRAQIAAAQAIVDSSSAEQPEANPSAVPQEVPTCASPVPNALPEGVPSSAPTAQHVTVDVPEISTPAAIATTDKREEMLQFIETHSNESPLQLFESVAFKDPEVAAFYAVQEKRMFTPDSDFPATGVFQQSMHEEVLVYDEPSSLGAPSLRAAEGSALGALQKGGSHYLQLTQVVLQDLRAATMAQLNEQAASAADTRTLFPHGLTCALRTGRFDRRDEREQISKKLNKDELVSFVHEFDSFELGMVEDLAANNPAAASFFHFVAHALNFSHVTKDRPTKRYEYFEGDDQLRNQQTNSGDEFLPVFLAGVRRNPDFDESDNGEWRVVIDAQWQPVDTKVDVIRQVLLEALEHLEKQAPTPGMPIYPLVAYHLLAQAVGVPVPSYLKDHENQILKTLAKNKTLVEERRQEIVQEQHDTAIRLENQAEEDSRRYDEYGVSDAFQFSMCSTADFPRTLAAESTDATISVPTNSARLDAMSAIRLRMVGDDNVPGTHRKQEISSRSHSLSSQDNLCWLRSAWLSLFETASPGDIAARLVAITGPTRQKTQPYNSPLVEAIAQLYRDDPTGFMHAENKGTGAHLGPSMALGNFLGDRVPAGVPDKVLLKSVEHFLRGLHIGIATAYRAKGSPLMSELAGLFSGRPTASSNLPMTLHRAMNVPLLVVEAEPHVRETLLGRQVNCLGQLRIAAPTGSDLAEQAEPLAKAIEPNGEDIKELVRAFDRKPILWLEGEHYDLYLPL